MNMLNFIIVVLLIMSGYCVYFANAAAAYTVLAIAFTLLAVCIGIFRASFIQIKKIIDLEDLR